eukprot:CAMPEP_0169164514 /NCGR_PEP_ID=MMETSP1015-20121227/58887_1 /TAXON_ID=342587 /ORGANISM="Karlodinium micrum, Strain CCMP2283" /LENGTH=676 /DNA_ID=CAMNT_0009236979 /DNA_START=9 /DNA_END=2037 /DNA_ORIENTATION=+
MARLHSTMVTPGPGTYSLRRAASSPCCTARHIPSGRGAFRSRVPQISPAGIYPGSTEFAASSIKDNPGPGEYWTSGDIAQPMQVKKDSSHGLSSISYSKSMPSMPPKRDPKLIRFSGRDTDRPGPGDIGTEIDLSRNRRTPAATNFHASSTQRQLFSHNASIDNVMPPHGQPGPGLYTTFGELNRGPSSPFKSLTPQVPSLAKDGPGPGTYHWPEDAGGSEEKPLPTGTFRSSSGRGQSWQQLSHPFTTRHSNDPLERKFHGVHQPHQVIALRDTDGLKLCGFDSSVDRSCNKPDIDNGVPSLAYNIEDSMGQSMKWNIREKSKIGGKGVFGCSADRSHGFVFAPPRGESPGPGEHQSLEKRDGFYNMKGEQSVRGFRSTEPRLPRNPAEASPQPSPGSYEIVDKVNYRNKFRRAKVQHLSFGSGGSRWNPNEVFSGKMHTPHPGPGEYSPRLSVGVSGGKIGSTSRDLSALPSTGITPGPGQYNTHVSTMHLMTYNVSGPEAAQRAQGYYQSLEPPNIGGGAGGGISGTRSRLGQSSGGSGANAAAMDVAVRERRKNKHDSSRSQSGTSSPKASPKGGRSAGREESLRLITKDAVGMAFVTEPIGLARGWTPGKTNSSPPQATSKPEALVELDRQPQSIETTTSDQAVPEAVVANTVAEEKQEESIDNSVEPTNV